MEKVSSHSRFTWAIAEMEFQRKDKVLEIGPGSGIALEMIAGCVSSGRVVALDQSQTMLAKAEARLKKAGLNQRVTFMKGDAVEADLSGFRFDKVFAFNVNIFLKNIDLSQILNSVVKGGTVGIFYQNPPGSDQRRLKEMMNTVQAIMNKYQFQVLKVLLLNDLKERPTGGVVAGK